MVEIISSEQYSAVSAVFPALLKDLCDALVEHCGLTRVSEIDTETEYTTVLLYPDNYKAVKFSAIYSTDSGTATYTIYDGYYTDEFVSVGSSENTMWNRDGYTRSFMLYIINGGSAFTIVLHTPRQTGGFYDDPCTSSVKVGDYYALTLHTINAMLFTSTNNIPIIRTPLGNVALSFPLINDSYQYMGKMIDTDIVAFPWILYTSSDLINLGVPTIGGKKVYTRFSSEDISSFAASSVIP